MSKETLDVRVVRIGQETHDVRSFLLEAADGNALPKARPGAHITVTPAPGISRPYSVILDPAQPGRYLIGVKNVAGGRGGSAAMHGLVREGTMLSISRPRNNFGLLPADGRRILLAGGIGITPLLSMAQALSDEGKPFSLHYFLRSNRDRAFTDLITRSNWGESCLQHLNISPAALQPLLRDILGAHATGDTVYMCGPQLFMEAVQVVAAELDWPTSAIVFESFAASAPTLVAGGSDFIVKLARSGQELLVPSERSIVDVVREAGVDIKTNCEQGVCGTCLTRVLEGAPDHQDLFLTDEEREQERLMTLCVSRSHSKLLVLNL